MTYTTKTKNVYSVVDSALAQSSVAADTLLEAVTAKGGDLISAKLIETGVLLSVPDGNLSLKTESSSASMGSAYPASYSSFPSGGTVVLTAVPASGYEFVKWNRNGALVSTDNPALVTVSSLSGAETEAVYTAFFQAISST